MLGCIATAPPNKAAIPTTFPGNFGGNMEYDGMGDAHARKINRPGLENKDITMVFGSSRGLTADREIAASCRLAGGKLPARGFALSRPAIL